jgi:hypothetical protein
LSDLRTNRDLYLSIEKLAEEYKSCDRSLDEYLRALLEEANRFAACESLSLNDFYELLRAAFTAPPHQFEEDWRERYDRSGSRSSDFGRWQATLIRQIVDLREMEENGTLSDEDRYFGVDSPRQSRWYNFEPVSYLECAIAGSFGGWEPDDESNRQLVTGRVTVIAEDGSIQDADPQDLPRPQFEMPAITWDQFDDFIQCGQWYE